VATGRSTGGTNGHQIVVADFPDVARSKGDQGLGATRGGYEFHLERIRRVDINDRAQITTPQPLSGKVPVQHDDIKRVEAHRPSPRYAVMNRGTSPPAGINQTLTTTADCPVGPFRIARIVLTRAARPEIEALCSIA
jgi:hypothetical protein